MADGIPFDFLTAQIVRHMLYRTGFGELEEAALAYIENSPSAVRSLCASYRESPVGSPIADCEALGMSVASLNKLYYFARMRRQLPTPSIVFEFGGGYGHMCHILQTLLSPRPTCVIFDLPELLVLQYAFLEASGLTTRAHTHAPVRLEPGAVNLVPVQFMETIETPCDLFLSTFALSETPTALQSFVAERRFLGAASLYLTGQVTDAPLWSQYELEDMRTVRQAAQDQFGWVSIDRLPAVSAWELIASREPLVD